MTQSGIYPQDFWLKLNTKCQVSAASPVCPSHKNKLLHFFCSLLYLSCVQQVINDLIIGIFKIPLASFLRLRIYWKYIFKLLVVCRQCVFIGLNVAPYCLPLCTMEPNFFSTAIPGYVPSQEPNFSCLTGEGPATIQDQCFQCGSFFLLGETKLNMVRSSLDGVTIQTAQTFTFNLFKKLVNKTTSFFITLCLFVLLLHTVLQCLFSCILRFIQVRENKLRVLLQHVHHQA